MILYLDNNSNVSISLGFPDFKATLAQQIATSGTAKIGAHAA